MEARVRSILCRGPIINAAGVSMSPDSYFPTPSAAAELAARDKSTAGGPINYDGEKIIGLYFSAHWCPPCRGFTPQLKNAYRAVKADPTKDFEIIFCTWDNDAAQYKEYAAEMPWSRLPMGDTRINELAKHFNVQSIPTLVMLRARDCHVISTTARNAVPGDQGAHLYPWPGSAGGAAGGAGLLSKPIVWIALILVVGWWLFVKA